MFLSPYRFGPFSSAPCAPFFRPLFPPSIRSFPMLHMVVCFVPSFPPSVCLARFARPIFSVMIAVAPAQDLLIGATVFAQAFLTRNYRVRLAHRFSLCTFAWIFLILRGLSSLAPSSGSASRSSEAFFVDRSRDCSSRRVPVPPLTDRVWLL